MEFRRLQATGGASLTVSLPKKWVTANQLKKGDLLSVSAQGSTICLQTGAKAAKPEAIIDVSKPLLSRSLITAYLSGYDVIRLQSDTRIPKEKKDEIKAILPTLMGMEIVEETGTELLLRDLLDPQEVDVKKTIRRAYTIAASMHKDAAKALRDADKALAEEVIQRDREVDRLYFLTVRQLKKALVNPSLGLAPAECLDLRVAIKSLEELADHCCNIAEHVSAPIDVSEMSDFAYKMHENAFAAYVEHDLKKAHDVRAQHDAVISMKNRLYSAENAFFLDELEDISGCAVDLSDLIV